MLRRGVPTTPRLTVLLGGGAALGMANVAACLTRSRAFSSVVLLWHGGTMALMLVLPVAAADRIMRCPTLSR